MVTEYVMVRQALANATRDTEIVLILPWFDRSTAVERLVQRINPGDKSRDSKMFHLPRLIHITDTLLLSARIEELVMDQLVSAIVFLATLDQHVSDMAASMIVVAMGCA